MATTKPRATQIRGLASQQAPFLADLIPDSNLPNSTGNYRLKGAFFTPNMTVNFDGNHIINYITFISDNEVLVNMTLGSAEGTFGVTLNNGIEAYFPNALLVVLGDVYTPNGSDWYDVNRLEPLDGGTRLLTYNVEGIAKWNPVTDITKDFRISFSIVISPLGPGVNEFYVATTLQLIGLTSGSVIFGVGTNQSGYGNCQLYANASDGTVQENAYQTIKIYPSDPPHIIDIEQRGGNLYVYLNRSLKKAYTGTINENFFVQSKTKGFDIKNLKHIELAT